MKRSLTYKLTIVLLLLTLVTAVLMFNTFSKYATTVDVAGNLTFATWDFSEAGITKTVTVNQNNTTPDTTGNVAAGVIVPGSSGVITIQIVGNAEVNATYFITFTDPTVGYPVGFSFWVGSTANSVTALSKLNTLNSNQGIIGKIAHSTNKQTITVEVNWKWDFDTGTLDGYKADKLAFETKVEIKQDQASSTI